jgi:hypothetical protein
MVLLASFNAALPNSQGPDMVIKGDRTVLFPRWRGKDAGFRDLISRGIGVGFAVFTMACFNKVA